MATRIRRPGALSDPRLLGKWCRDVDEALQRLARDEDFSAKLDKRGGTAQAHPFQILPTLIQQENGPAVRAIQIAYGVAFSPVPWDDDPNPGRMFLSPVEPSIVTSGDPLTSKLVGDPTSEAPWGWIDVDDEADYGVWYTFSWGETDIGVADPAGLGKPDSVRCFSGTGSSGGIVVDSTYTAVGDTSNYILTLTNEIAVFIGSVNTGEKPVNAESPPVAVSSGDRPTVTSQLVRENIYLPAMTYGQGWLSDDTPNSIGTGVDGGILYDDVD